MIRGMIRILICLVLGIVTTVGVAWGLALKPGPYEFVETGGPGVQAHTGIDLATRRLWLAVTHEDWGRYGVDTVASYSIDDALSVNEVTEAQFLDQLGQSRQAGTRDIPAWSAVRSSLFDDVASIAEFAESISDRAFGWPALTLSSHWHGHFDTASREWHRDVRRGIPLDATSSPVPKHAGMLWFVRSGEPIILPVRPIWPGFLINTLFHAAIWLALLFGLTATRRTIRRRRGRCVKCGYNLRADFGNGCSECGWNRSDR